MNRILVLSLALSMLLSLAAGCSTPGTHVGRAAPRVVEKKPVHAYRLENGFTVLVHTGESDGPTAVQVWVADGSAHEPPGKPGVAHFVEHMLFEGAKGLPAGRAEELLESMGGSLTGNTGKDYSYVGVTLPGPGWERALDILYAMTTSPDFDPEKVEGQRKLISLERKYEKSNADMVLMEGLMDEAYRTHPYRNPITGTDDSVKTFTAEDIAAYHKSAYLPSNMTLVVAGSVDPQEVKDAAEGTFGTLKPSAQPKPAPMNERSQLSGRQRRVFMPVSMTYMAMGWHTCPTTDDDIFGIEVLKTIMGQGAGSRLATELRERKALAVDVAAELFEYRYRGLFVVTAVLGDSSDINRVKEDILRQALKLKTDLVSEEELRRAVLGIERQQMLATDTAEGKAYSLGYWATVFGGQSRGEYMDHIRGVTAEDVRRVAQTYLGEGNYTLSIIKPE